MSSSSITQLTPEVKSLLRTGVAITSVTQCIEEMVLNSIDSGASCIAVRVDMSCYKFQVADNGCGISEEQLGLVGQRYSTSKCHTVGDLDNLCYYGYRGEAIASLKDVTSLLEIVSRTKTSARSYCKMFQKGRSLSVIESSVNRPSAGTTVTVHDLFYNLPVRRNVINANLEVENIKKRLEAIALIKPGISVTLRNDKSLILKKQKANDSSSQADNSLSLTSSPTKYSEKHGMYVMDIKCPYTQYDITFEPAKTLVEFRDWDTVILCIEEIVQEFLKRENLQLGIEKLSSKTVDEESEVMNGNNENDEAASRSDEHKYPDIHVSTIAETPDEEEQGDDIGDLGKNYGRGISTQNTKNGLFSEPVKRKLQITTTHEGYNDDLDLNGHTDYTNEGNKNEGQGHPSFEESLYTPITLPTERKVPKLIQKPSVESLSSLSESGSFSDNLDGEITDEEPLPSLKQAPHPKHNETHIDKCMIKLRSRDMSCGSSTILRDLRASNNVKSLPTKRKAPVSKLKERLNVFNKRLSEPGVTTRQSTASSSLSRFKQGLDAKKLNDRHSNSKIVQESTDKVVMIDQEVHSCGPHGFTKLQDIAGDGCNMHESLSGQSRNERFQEKTKYEDHDKSAFEMLTAKKKKKNDEDWNNFDHKKPVKSVIQRETDLTKEFDVHCQDSSVGQKLMVSHNAHLSVDADEGYDIEYCDSETNNLIDSNAVEQVASQKSSGDLDLLCYEKIEDLPLEEYHTKLFEPQHESILSPSQGFSTTCVSSISGSQEFSVYPFHSDQYRSEISREDARQHVSQNPSCVSPVGSEGFSPVMPLTDDDNEENDCKSETERKGSVTSSQNISNIDSPVAKILRSPLHVSELFYMSETGNNTSVTSQNISKINLQDLQVSKDASNVLHSPLHVSDLFDMSVVNDKLENSLDTSMTQIDVKTEPEDSFHGNKNDGDQLDMSQIENRETEDNGDESYMAMTQSGEDMMMAVADAAEATFICVDDETESLDTEISAHIESSNMCTKTCVDCEHSKSEINVSNTDDISYFGDDDDLVSVKWKDKLLVLSEEAKTEELGLSVDDLFKKWNNPVFEKPDREILNAEVVQSSKCDTATSKVLYPHRFTKEMLKHAKVLGQVDNKFIACLFPSKDQNNAAYCKDDNGIEKIVSSAVVPPEPTLLSQDEVRIMTSFKDEFERIGAIKFGHRLSLCKCEELVQSLNHCKLPFQCAHGRPSIVPILNLDKIPAEPEARKAKIWKISGKLRQMNTI
ncbi:hypothetical protein KUTeg_014450 [Tegillarca granosa]|uniref:DNA mismatch repair protein S5 domain-containing protein n=1 Tax=Tegillarca granosa TaxID=220873 RepID=A0ABQ9EWK9_TEGGR|nr:hypothetical protein KUTeg_014450 [Tegillarca granosa]